MADVLLDLQSTPTTPAAGKIVLMGDTNKLPAFKNADGKSGVMGSHTNGSIVNQAGFAADTYVTDSDLLIPSFGLQARTQIRWTMSATKTAAGAAAPAYSIRIGAARTVADTARLVINGPLQTAAIDGAVIFIHLMVRTIGAAGVIAGFTHMNHNLAATGFANNASGHVEAVSAGFDNSVAAMAGLFIGLSINGGAAAAWTMTQVRAEAMW